MFKPNSSTIFPQKTKSNIPRMTSNYIQNIWKSEYYRKSFINYITKNYFIKNKRGFINAINNVIGGNSTLDDITILKIIVNLLSMNPQRNFYKMNGRAEERSTSIMNMIEIPKINCYLDYGCGDGTITYQLGKKLGLTSKEVFGIDIHLIGNPGITYLNPGVDVLKDKSIDLVTAFVSLHHISDVNAALCEISRVLRPGGTFIIREHDYDNTEILQQYLHLMHMFISVRDFGECDIEGAIINGIHYKSAEEWTFEIEKHGMKFIKTDKYTGNNPQNLYYAVYIKQ